MALFKLLFEKRLRRSLVNLRHVSAESKMENLRKRQKKKKERKKHEVFGINCKAI